MPTKLWDVRAALVDLLTETLNVPVFDGPVARKTPPKTFVLVGTDGGESGTGEASADGYETRQSWAALGSTGRRNEEGEIVCAAWAWSGSTDLTDVRTTVRDLTDQIEAALVADRQLGGVLPAGHGAELARFSLTERQREGGGYVRATLTVAYTTRLTPS